MTGHACSHASGVNGRATWNFDGCLSGTYSVTAAFPASSRVTPMTASLTVEYVQNVGLSGGTSEITSVTLMGGLPIPTITSALPLPGSVGVPYSHTFTASGGTGALSLTSSGPLPTGLTLTDGVLSGTPTVAGSYDFRVTAKDSAPTDNGGPVSSAPQIVTLVINKQASTTTLTSSMNPSLRNQTVTFTVEVTSPSGTPTGTVTLRDGGTVLIAAGLVSGKATFITSALTVGSHAITADYGGSGTFAESSDGLTQVVNPATQSALTVQVVANGRDGTFAYTATGPGLAGFSLTTSGGSASRAFNNLGAGTYTVTQGALPTGWQLDSIVCNGAPQTGNTASVTLTGLNAVTCVITNRFDEAGIRAKTQAVIRNFLEHRAEAIASSEPQGTSGVGKLTGWLFGGGGTQTPTTTGQAKTSNLGGPSPLPGSNDARVVTGRTSEGREGGLDSRAGRAMPFTVSGSAQDGTGSMQFSTSLSQMRKAAAEAQAGKETAANSTSGQFGLMALGARSSTRSGTPGTTPPLSEPPLYDVWMEGRTSYFEDDRVDARQSGYTHLFYAGADYRIHPAILVGALVQFDWADEKSGALGTSADGTGWMAGPYISTRLTQNLTLDARAAWGRSDNNVNPLGLYQDSFDTNRSLYSARLTGNWISRQWRFTPGATLVYFDETQHSYLDSLSIDIPEQSVKLGRLTFGPEVGYRFRLAGADIEPFVGLKGVWDFDKDDTGTIGGFVVGNDDWRGRAEAGAVIAAPWGLSVRAAGAYEGIGDSSLKLYQGELTVSAPLN